MIFFSPLLLLLYVEKTKTSWFALAYDRRERAEYMRACTQIQLFNILPVFF